VTTDSTPTNAGATPEGGRLDMRRFIGVSLGGGRGKTTAVARLELDPSTGVLTLAEARARWGQRGGGEVADQDDEHGSAFRDDVLLRWLGDWVDDHSVVAFDAPLTLPPCVRCQLTCPGIDACTVPVVGWMRNHAERLSIRTGRSDPGKPAVTPYTQRATELLLERATLQPREALGQGMGPLAARAAYLRRALSPRLRLHENLIEVHPRATLIRRFGLRDERRARQGEVERTWETRKTMLGMLVEGLAFDRVWPELVVRNVHVFHAVVAAFTAWFWAREGWRGPEDLLEPVDPAVDPNRPNRLAKPIAELGDLWLEDGWIWTPPRR
jgi:predicted nuclease with RNAse H fold